MPRAHLLSLLTGVVPTALERTVPSPSRRPPSSAPSSSPPRRPPSTRPSTSPPSPPRLRRPPSPACHTRPPHRPSLEMALANRSKTAICKLPFDLLAEILLRIPPHPRSFLTVTAVCSDWRQLIRSNGFREIALSHNGGAPLLGFFYRSRDNDRCFITEHVLDRAMLPKLPLRDEDNLDEIGSDSDGGIYGTLRILACRHGHVLLHCSASPYMLVRDPIRNINTFICEPSWRSFQTHFNGTIICSSSHDASFTHNCHTSNFCVFWITTDNKKVQVKMYSLETRRWDLIAAMPMIAMARVRASSPATLRRAPPQQKPHDDLALDYNEEPQQQEPEEYYYDDTVDSDDEYDHYEKMLKLLEGETFKVYRSRGYRALLMLRCWTRPTKAFCSMPMADPIPTHGSLVIGHNTRLSPSN